METNNEMMQQNNIITLEDGSELILVAEIAEHQFLALQIVGEEPTNDGYILEYYEDDGGDTYIKIIDSIDLTRDFNSCNGMREGGE